MQQRFELLKQWLVETGYDPSTLQVASEDASFRRYFRFNNNSHSLIVMDAPPEKESCAQYLTVTQLLRSGAINVPEIHAKNRQLGFLVMTDFGDSQYLSMLSEKTVDALYADALKALLKMQRDINASLLPEFNEAALRMEMDLFLEWFLQKLLGIELSEKHYQLWRNTTDVLVRSALQQPQVFVHRDYHSRNLMYLEQNNPGIIDFQDAVKGPVTYDLVSLIRDCYIDWPQSRVNQWAMDFYEQASLQYLKEVESGQFIHWFNLMGVQRHLKAIGIFSRLKLRDEKPGFVADIPRTLNYIETVASDVAELSGLNQLIKELNLQQRLAALR